MPDPAAAPEHESLDNRASGGILREMDLPKTERAAWRRRRELRGARGEGSRGLLMHPRALFAAALLLSMSASGCGDGESATDSEGGAAGSTSNLPPGAGGAGGSGAASGGGGHSTDSGGGGAVEGGVAPPGEVAGEEPLADGDNAISMAIGEEAVLRLEVEPSEHVGFFLTFEPGIPGVTLELSRWDGHQAQRLAITDAGIALRTLAAFDASGPRTFWLRVAASDAFVGSLEVVRTPFTDGATCEADCERLLQLPVANDPQVDGYDWRPSTVFRYQFGRRDLVMLLRYAARRMALDGRAAIIAEDLSQWDGQTPGTDVGAPRHASHAGGKDVDISLYGTDGLCEWRSYCDTVTTANGRECLPGSESGFDGRANAELYAAFLQSGRVTMSFLDGELISSVEDGATDAANAGSLDATLLPLFSDGVHLQHWANHDNHIHVRLSEQPYDALGRGLEPLEAP